jgi:DNA-binding response OmpR family regulator
MDEVLTKPIDPAVLVDTVAHWARRSRTAGSTGAPAG